MANRSMDAKYKRAVSQRQALGAAEGCKPAYHTNKPLLREIAANCDPDMVKRHVKVIDTKAPVMVLYNPRQPQHKKSLAVLCMVACDGELVKKADYLRK